EECSGRVGGQVEDHAEEGYKCREGTVEAGGFESFQQALSLEVAGGEHEVGRQPPAEAGDPLLFPCLRRRFVNLEDPPLVATRRKSECRGVEPGTKDHQLAEAAFVGAGKSIEENPMPDDR